MFPRDIHHRIDQDFGPAATTVLAELERFRTSYQAVASCPPPDRVLRCVLHLARAQRETLGM